MVNEQALDVRQAAKKLQLSPTKVRSLIRTGALPGKDVSGGKKRPTYRVAPEALERWLAGAKSK